LVDRCDQPQAASVFRKKRTPTKTGKRQRMGLARLAVASTRFAVTIHRDGCVASAGKNDFWLRHSAKNSRTCPRKAVGMPPGVGRVKYRGEFPHGEATAAPIGRKRTARTVRPNQPGHRRTKNFREQLTHFPWSHGERYLSRKTHIGYGAASGANEGARAGDDH
jgi:hypothetical protein